MIPMKTKFIIPLCLVALIVSNAAPDSADRKPSRLVANEPVWDSNSGPWGNLEIHSLYIEAPNSMLEALPKPNSTPRWCFSLNEEPSLKVLFTKAKLPQEVQDRLLDPQRKLVQDDVLTLFPQLSDLLALTIEQRSIIYDELAKSELNEFHAFPVYVLGGDVADWLREARLTDEQKKIVTKLIWHRGNAVVFSDVSALLNYSHSDAEVLQVFKLMTRMRTLIVNIKLPPGIDWKPLAHYWTAEHRMLETQPMLVSASERDSVTTLDITHLLPSLPRHLIYSYPSFELASRGRMPDCHWTSLNFFNTQPKNYYLDTRIAATNLKEHYNIVDPPYHFGDVLCIQTGEGVSHSCVYIADDIVYSKNGENAFRPWLFLWKKDVEDIYLTDPNLHWQGYRFKPASTP